MLNSNLEKQLREHFNQRQEFAFVNPLREVAEIEPALASGKFRIVFKFTEQWLVSVCLTVSPDDSNQNHFWHASVAYVSKQSGKPKSRFLWTNKESNIAKYILKLALEDVAISDLDNGEKPILIEFKGEEVAMHGYKNLSVFERQEIFREKETKKDETMGVGLSNQSGGNRRRKRAAS